MDSLQQVIFWAGNTTEAVLLIRLGVNGSFCRYALFSSYLLMILLRSLTDLWVLHSHPTIYAYVYWYVTEPVSASLGSLVIFELYRRVLELYPGVARLARKLIAVIFALVLSRFLVHAVFSQQSNAGVNVLILLRDLRIVQSAFLVGIILLVRHYGIAIGKNLAGMIGG